MKFRSELSKNKGSSNIYAVIIEKNIWYTLIFSLFLIFLMALMQIFQIFKEHRPKGRGLLRFQFVLFNNKNIFSS